MSLFRSGVGAEWEAAVPNACTGFYGIRLAVEVGGIVSSFPIRLIDNFLKRISSSMSKPLVRVKQSCIQLTCCQHS